MSDEGEGGKEETKEEERNASPAHEDTEEQSAPNSDDASTTKLNELYDKYNIREKEIERLERQNEEYREKLIRAIRERDEIDEGIKVERKEKNAKVEELERKIMDFESQLKVTKDRANAQELHFNRTTQALIDKFNKQVNDLSKKMETAESEKNQSVVKYAMREAELMKLTAEIAKKTEETKTTGKELAEMRQSSDMESLKRLEQTNEDLRVEMEKIKNEKFDAENRMKMAERRAEASQAAIKELNQQQDVLRRQVISLKEDKATLQEEYRGLTHRIQAEEERLRQKEEQVNNDHTGKEELYRKIVHDAARAKEKNVELGGDIENLMKENTSLMEELEAARDRFTAEEERANEIQKALDHLKGIEGTVNGALDAEKQALKAKEDAEAEKIVAENEAEECRKQAERMLELTESLTKKNTDLVAELTDARDKVASLQNQLGESRGAHERLQSTDRDVEAEKAACSAEIDSLKQQLAEKMNAVQELSTTLAEQRNDAASYKKKSNSAIKELKLEASNLRRQLAAAEMVADPLIALDLPAPSSTLPSVSSRTSSLTSIDQVGQTLKAEPEDTSSAHSNHSTSPPAEDINIPAQQAMIEKIVKLQKQLLRRKEKIEFLEEHVRQCLDELQKKTKLIQHYTLREEASLLLPADDLNKLMNLCEVVQVPIAPKTSSSYALMGSIFSGGGTSEKKSLQLATEVNSRLQAVLEDTLLKNFSLKENVDKLGDEISRLLRENRRLTLSQK